MNGHIFDKPILVLENELILLNCNSNWWSLHLLLRAQAKEMIIQLVTLFYLSTLLQKSDLDPLIIHDKLGFHKRGI
jgi:hypothetical protein